MLSKEQKIKLILDLENGNIPKKAAKIFKPPYLFCVLEKDRCINNVYFDEVEFAEMIEYIEQFSSLLYVQSLDLMQNFNERIRN